MACGLAVARGGLILGGLVLGLDIGGELVEFFDCAIHRRGGRIQDELGIVDVFLHALAVSGVVLVGSATCEGKDEQPTTNKAPLKARISFMAAPSFHRDYRQKAARLQGRSFPTDRWRRRIRFKARARQRCRNGAGRRYRARL